MSTPVGSSQWMYSTAAGFYPYLIDQSLRFNDDDSPALSKAYSTAQTNTKILTISVWVKRANLGIRTTILYANSSGTAAKLSFQTTDKLYFNAFNTGYNGFESSAVFRDTSSWYHIVAQADSQDQTGANINRVWVNGVELENSKTSSFVPDDTASMLLRNGVTTYIGDDTDGAYHFDGYLAEMHVIDGSVIAPTSFGETINGIWVPKEVSGLTYGTNGFYLSFADSSAIGDDLSGNANDFTATNLAASDVMSGESPTNNFATLNSAANFTPATLAEGNLKATPASSSDKRYHSTFPISSGKWYCEIRIVSTGTRNQIGFWSTENTGSTSVPTNYAFLGVGNSSNATSGTFNGTAFTASAGDILTYAFDADDGKLYFGRNAAPTIGATADFTGLASDTYVLGQRETGTLNTTNHFNFGQDSTFAGAITAGGNADENGYGDFAYAPPSGFLALCSANLPEPTLSPNAEEQADDYFSTTLWSGDGNDGRTITGVGFQPDWVWVKDRNTARSHVIQDSVRGFNDGDKVLRSNGTNSESSTDNDVFGFVGNTNSDGYTLEDGTTDGRYVNNSGETYVAWNWKAGGTAVSNTDGSITSSVSAAPDAGFSICTYTGTSTVSESFGHGLNQAPELVITKARNTTDAWRVHGSVLGTDKFLALSGTNAVATDSSNGGFPDNTDTLVNLGYESTNGTNYVAYCFHSVDGFSKVGSYVGNGSTDGTFVYTGFRPSFILAKSTASGNNWFIKDSSRSPHNVVNLRLYANASNAEMTQVTFHEVDFLSNGFKLRGNGSEDNGNGNTHIYLAFAEAPFKFANAR